MLNEVKHLYHYQNQEILRYANSSNSLLRMTFLFFLVLMTCSTMRL